MSFSHLLILGIIAVIVIPPDKLPEVARQIARFLGEMRRMSSAIFDDLKQDPQLKPEDNLKRHQEREQAMVNKQQAEKSEHVQQELFQEPVAPFQEPIQTLTPEQIKKAEEEYLKHIQGEPVVIAEDKNLEKKIKDE